MNHHLGPSGYDCHSGLSKWKSGWSSSKKDWCCTSVVVGFLLINGGLLVARGEQSTENTPAAFEMIYV